MKAKVNSEKGYTKEELMKIIEQIDADRCQSEIKEKAGKEKSNRKING